jgi:TatD DNase family protein
MKLFDTHCHLGDEKIRPIVKDILENAQQKNIQGLCVICADPENIRSFDSYLPELRLLAPQIQILRSAGLHPHEAQHWSSELEALIENQLKSDAVAVGETGLDYHYNFSEPPQQKKVFERHIDWACEFQKPLVIHCREAASDVLKQLDRRDIRDQERPGILHCFTESKDVARQLLDQNFMISFSGIVTFNNAHDLREVAAYVPDDRLLIETDSPYLAPKPFRGRPNEPAYLEHTFQQMCELRKAEPQKLAALLWKNSHFIYNTQETHE